MPNPASASPSDAGYLPGSAEYRRVSRALFLAGLATFATIYCTQPLLPLLADTFAVSPATSALSVSATTLALGAALLLLGPLSEAYGRVTIMHVSLFGSAVVTLLTAVVPTWAVLLVLRALLGLTVAGLPAVAVAYLREEIAPGARAQATGLYIGGTAIGGMLGRLVSGVLADVGGWRLAVGGIGALALACALAVRVLVPASRHFEPVPLRPADLTAMTRRVLVDPALLALYAIAFLTMGAFVGTYNAMGFRLAGDPYRLSVGVAGLVFVVYALGSVSSTYAGRQADRVGYRTVVPVAIVVMLVGLLLTLATPLPVVVLGLAVLTTGFFACHGVASGWVAARAAVGGPGAGQAGSLYLFGYYLGSSVAGTVAGMAWSRGRWPLVDALTVTLVALALVLALVLRRIPSLLEPKADDPGVVGM